MNNDSELTYEEYLLIKKDDFNKEVNEITRNIKFNKNDLEGDFLSEEFYKRKDINEIKKERLKYITEEFKNKLI